MKKIQLFSTVLILSLLLAACGASLSAGELESKGIFASSDAPFVPVPTSVSVNIPGAVSAAHPCIGAPAPAHWKHVVVLMFENKSADEILGKAPYITALAKNCATAINWMDADTKVDGTKDGQYDSKPNYTTLTSGVSPSVHGIVKDTYEKTTNVDNIYHQMALAGLSFKDYYEAGPGGCSVRFSGDYHDAVRFYTDVADICNAHDVPLSTFMKDLANDDLPAFSMLLPNKDHSMHNNSIASGDEYAKTILDPLLNSPAYARGDVAVFFLWDEVDPVSNVLMAPSIVPGTRINVKTGNPISHYSALRTWEDMLGLPLLGDTKSAPSLLRYFGDNG
ncbi:MAG: alkaline phosphatase family protein [Bacteroidota bacterium]